MRGRREKREDYLQAQKDQPSEENLSVADAHVDVTEPITKPTNGNEHVATNEW
jgi:hypothetical protein